MLFFIDENLSPRMKGPLSAFYPQHRFKTFEDEGLQGFDDIEVFTHLGTMQYDAIITKDGMQLVRPNERAALVDNDLHWIGLEEPVGLGRMSVPVLTSTALAGFQRVLNQWQPHLAAYRLPCPPGLSERPSIEPL